jgi:hypothetical protein
MMRYRVGPERPGAGASGGRARLLPAVLLIFAAGYGLPASAEDRPDAGNEVPVSPLGAEDFETIEATGAPEIIFPSLEHAGPPLGRTYTAMLRPGFWAAWSDTRLWKWPGTAVVALEESERTNDVIPLFPIEVFLRGENSEFRFRYFWWDYPSSGTLTEDFGIVPAGPFEAELDTNILGIDFLYRIIDYTGFDLFLATGVDVFDTRVDINSGLVRDSIEETVPIVTVGVGLRISVRDNVSIFASSSALSYSQLLGVDETFFAVNDMYKNIEVSLVFEPSENFNWGVGWKHYEVGFENDTLLFAQELKGPYAWLRLRF